MLRASTVFRTLTPFNFLMTPCFFGWQWALLARIPSYWQKMAS
jgi:hypothetical protein